MIRRVLSCAVQAIVLTPDSELYIDNKFISVSEFGFYFI